MDSKVQWQIKDQLILGFILGIYVMSAGGQESIEIHITPSNKITPGSDITVQCQTAQSLSNVQITWIRTMATMSSVIGVSVLHDTGGNNFIPFSTVEDDFSSLGRYKINSQQDGSKLTYMLHIEGAKTEDSSTISCKIGEYKGTGKVFSVKFAVCEDVTTSECSCMQKRGWADPTCYSNNDSELKSYRGALIGIVVCLIIAIIYGIVVSVMLSRDCMLRVKQRTQKKLETINKQITDRNRGNNTSIEGKSDKEFLNDSGSDTTGYHSTNGENSQYNSNSVHSLSSGAYAAPYSDYPIGRADTKESANGDSKYGEVQVEVHNYNKNKGARPKNNNPQYPRQPHTNLGFQNDDGNNTNLRPPSYNPNSPYITPTYPASSPDSRTRDHYNTQRQPTAPSVDKEQGNYQTSSSEPNKNNKSGYHTSGFDTSSNYNQPYYHNNRPPKQNSPQQLVQAPYSAKNTPQQINPENSYDMSNQQSNKHTPRSTQSEKFHKPVSEYELQQHNRAAYTDVTAVSGAADVGQLPAVRGGYAKPKQLDFHAAEGAKDTVI